LGLHRKDRRSPSIRLNDHRPSRAANQNPSFWVSRRLERGNVSAPNSLLSWIPRSLAQWHGLRVCRPGGDWSHTHWRLADLALQSWMGIRAGRHYWPRLVHTAGHDVDRTRSRDGGVTTDKGLASGVGIPEQHPGSGSALWPNSTLRERKKDPRTAWRLQATRSRKLDGCTPAAPLRASSRGTGVHPPRRPGLTRKPPRALSQHRLVGKALA
jgi:hypothetical protein